MLRTIALQIMSVNCPTMEAGETEKERVSELHHSLMHLELQLVDQLEVIEQSCYNTIIVQIHF